MTHVGVTTYLDREGRDSVLECISVSFDWCVKNDVSSVVIFTGTGDGPRYAAETMLCTDRYKHIRVTAVTPPFGRAYKSNPSAPESPVVRAGINPAMRDSLLELGIAVIAAHLPFKEINTGRARESEWSRVSEAYGVLGGGFSLCVQSALMACDAGAIESGERIVSITADTAISLISSRTESFLSPVDGLLVEHIICRPVRYTISKEKHVLRDRMWNRSTERSVPGLESVTGPQIPPDLPPSLPEQPRLPKKRRVIKKKLA